MEDSPWKDFSSEQLREAISAIQTEVAQASVDRNQAQLDHDAVQTFYDISKRELRELDAALAAKAREIQVAQESHRVEVRVYAHKVKALEYKHGKALTAAAGEDESTAGAEADRHARREAELRLGKTSLVHEQEELAAAQDAELKSLHSNHAKYVHNVRDSFQKHMHALETRYRERVDKLRAELELRRKVEIHEVEERKNQHIADLVTNHDAQFKKMKDFYNDITRKNLATIRELKAQMSDMKEKQVANQALMVDIAEENKRLADPLTVATAEVASLQADLRDAPKDRLALRNCRARTAALDDEAGALAKDIRGMEARYAGLEDECSQLRSKFDDAVSAVAARSDAKNFALESKLDSVLETADERAATLAEVVSAAGLDPSILRMVSSRIDAILDGRNAMIRELQWQVARVTKAHNDAVRVMEAKCEDMGIDTAPLDMAPLPSTTSTAPAALVTKPKFRPR